MVLSTKAVKTQAFTDLSLLQKPGTSGLRKSVDVFMLPNYTENFVQAIFNALPNEELVGSTLIVGGDGRYFMDQAVDIILKMAAANKVGKIVIGQNGFFSTPAVSCILRKRSALGAIILTASHNAGGPEGDFGIKYNTSNGGPAPAMITEAIYKESLQLTEYLTVDGLQVDLNSIGTKKFDVDGRCFEVEVISAITDYVDLMKEIFDFNKLKQFVKNVKIVANGMHAVTGPYLKAILVDELNAPDDSVINSVPKSDFAGKHPDPNMTYAADFVDLMKKENFKFGAAFDGDGDRNMLLGEHAFFVNPSDSIAVIAANADCIPYFKQNGLNGVARSMPTSEAVDKVAASKGMDCFEVPTGWKFFGNLMDAGKVALCGEESFGTGSDHVREKDGIWAFLAWLSILACREQSVKDIMEDHWQKYGRNYFTRYDYEKIEKEPADKVIGDLRAMIKNGSLAGQKFGDFVVKIADDFRYVDTIDKSVTERQGIRIIFEDGSRIIFRQSGTDSSGATIRMYIEKYEKNPDFSKPSEIVLKQLVDIALKISMLREITGREKPTVIT